MKIFVLLFLWQSLSVLGTQILEDGSTCETEIDDFGYGLCQNYVDIGCPNSEFQDDCNILKEIYYNETGITADWETDSFRLLRGSLSSKQSRSARKSKGFGKDEVASVAATSREQILLGEAACVSLEGHRGCKRRCIRYHKIRRGTCCENPSQGRCQKILSKYTRRGCPALPGCELSEPTSPEPSPVPTELSTPFPTQSPIPLPTLIPTSVPLPSSGPSGVPSSDPSTAPSSGPSSVPSSAPSAVTSSGPSGVPSSGPSSVPKSGPSFVPSSDPSSVPSAIPSSAPSAVASSGPSGLPSSGPSFVPSSGPSSSASSGSIIDNWDFEEETISPWKPNGEGVIVEKSQEHVYAGNYGAVVTGRTSSWHGSYQEILGIVQPGVIYEISVYAKLVGVPDGYSEIFQFNVHERFTLTIDDSPATYDSYPLVAGTNILTNQWTKISGSYQFDVDDGREMVYQNLYAQGPATAAFAIDNVVMQDARPSTVDVLVAADQNTERVVIPQPSTVDLTVPRSNCPHIITPNLVSWQSQYPTLLTGSDLTLPENQNILISESVTTQLGVLTIPTSSKLIFGENANGIALDVVGIKVEGSMVAGAETCRYETPLTITLHGSRPDGITDLSNARDPSYKGISVTGRLDLHGKRYYRTWTKLVQRAYKGDNYLYLQDAVNWESGQEIVMVTTALRDSRDWHQNEVLTIQSVQLSNLPHPEIGAIVILTSPLQYDHVARQEYQAEVGLLTRTIKVQGSENDSEATDLPSGTCDLLDHDEIKRSILGYDQVTCPNSYLTGYGGHMMVHSNGVGYVEGVELYRMGQTNVLGRYPMHFHLLDDHCPGCYFKDSSIHRSFYRCISIHGTHNIVVSENVGFDVIGYCYYLEDGVEEANTLSYNLAAHIHVLSYPAVGGPQKVNLVRESPDLTLPADITASGFYITNLRNRVIGNVAVGGWAGFAMPILHKPTGVHRNDDFAPRERTVLEFDGNIAHSTAHFWDKAAAFYFGGSLFYDGDDLVYNAGRENNDNDRRKPCIDDENGVCKRAWNRITNSKAFLVAGVGIGSWSGGMEVLGYECHDCGLAAEALVDGFWIDNMVANCRTGEALLLPVQRADWVRANGFFWYDTGQEHIITSSTFRNCGYRSDIYNQYDTSETRGCEANPYNGCDSGSTVFGFLTHSDQFNPELMQGTRDLTFEEVGRKFLFTTTHLETVSGRTQNWLDVDGTVSGLGEPTLIGSGFESAGLWWKVDDDVFMDEQAPLSFVKKNAGPARGLAHFRLEWDDALHDTVGGRDTCRNGGSGITEECPAVGRIRHLGSRFDVANDPEGGLPVTPQPEIVGLAGGFGWLLTLDDGAPHTLNISQIEVMPNTPLLLSVAYPTGTSFTIKAKAVDWCSESCTTSCEELFSRVSSVQKVRHSNGNVYHFDDATGLLTLRVIMYPAAYTGEPHWKLYNFDDVGSDGEYALKRFERNGILLPHMGYPQAHIEIAADCARNGAYCASAAPATSGYDDVCSNGFDQVSYDLCCDAANNCQEMGLLSPTMSPTISAAPTAYDPELVENGDFEDSVFCPWSPVGCTLDAISDYLLVTERTNTWSGPRLDVTERIHVGSTYNFQARIKFPSGDTENSISIKIQVAYTDSAFGYSYLYVAGSSTVNIGEWTSLTSSFDMNASKLKSLDVAKFTLYIETPPVNGVSSTWDFLVDSISMVDIHSVS